MNLYKILLVDDEAKNLKILYSYILESKEPYILFQALNAELALRIALVEKPDIIITDWEMSGMNGIELIKTLKLDIETTDIPVIMCTGVMTTSENLNTALSAGAVDFIRKPIDKIELLARIKSMLMLSDSRKVLKERYELIKQNVVFIHAIIESIPHPFLYYNLRGEILGCNSRFETLAGLPNSIITGSKLTDYSAYTDNDVHRNTDEKLRICRQDLSYESMFGDHHYVFSKTLFYNSGSEPEGIMCILTDVTELKHVHDELMENKKRELTSLALRLVHTGELNNSLISDLTRIYPYTNVKGSELINHAINKFNINSGDNFWKEFESQFENVYVSFYSKLNSLFPGLSSREKKLCTLLRLNMSSKDIATLVFQNPQSVDMARYRLRKKFNLKQEENLIDFLMNLC